VFAKTRSLEKTAFVVIFFLRLVQECQHHILFFVSVFFFNSFIKYYSMVE
jgi:hypothetical protein